MIDKQRGYLPTTSMREMIGDNAMLLPAISRFNIAFGFGDATVEEVCRENGVDEATFLNVCNLLSGYRYDAKTISLPALMGYLRRAHTSFVDIEFPKIRHHLLEAINYGSANNSVALTLIQFYDDYVEEARHHMENENDVVFRYVEQLLKGEAEENFTFTKYTADHSDTVAKLNELKDVFIYHYKQRNNARLSATLFDIIMCERDLLSHFNVENHLFIPAVEQLEREVKSNLENREDRGDSASPSGADQLALLSEREKEIIKYVALGMANKEIADKLFISVHTVATHRRNIASKLDVHTSAGIVIFAILHGLVDVNEITPV